jgi:hypothetical protein
VCLFDLSLNKKVQNVNDPFWHWSIMPPTPDSHF